MDGNTNTLPLTVTVEKVGANQVRAKVLAGAPFAVDISVTLVNGTLTGSVTELSVAAGAVYSEPVTMTRTAGTTAAATVDVDLTTQPTLPAAHRGYEFVKATVNLPATILPDPTVDNVLGFSETAPRRAVPENSAAGVDVGAPVTATPADSGDTLEYTLEGTDASSFDIVSTSGQIQTKSGVTYNYEEQSSYAVTVKASDGTDSATVDVTINLRDVAEQPDKPAKPTLAAVSGSATRLDASWTEPGRNGGPAITGYEVQYREGPSGNVGQLRAQRRRRDQDHHRAEGEHGAPGASAGAQRRDAERLVGPLRRGPHQCGDGRPHGCVGGGEVRAAIGRRVRVGRDDRVHSDLQPGGEGHGPAPADADLQPR